MKLFRFISLSSICVTLASAVAIAADAPQSTYHLAKTYKFGAAPGGSEYFDYITVDPQTRRVYLGHGTEVLIMNADTGKIQGKVSGFKRQHGVALAPDLGLGFISDGDGATVTIFNLKTLQKVADVKAAEDADCVVYDPVSKRVFSLNGDPNSSTAIDAKEGKVVGTVALGGKPEFGVADGKGMIYANLVDKNQVVAFDSRTLDVKSHWPVAPAGSPVSMAIDRKNRRLFIGARNPAMLVVMNADNGQVIQTFPITGGVDAAVFDPGTARVFLSTRDGYIHIFHQDSPDKYSEAGQVKTEVGAKTMGYDSKTQNLITDTSDFGPPSANGRPNPIPGTFRVLVFSK